MIARDVLNQGYQPNVLKPNFNNASAKTEYDCSNSCYTYFPVDEMYSIHLQMAELGEPELHTHTCPHPA